MFELKRNLGFHPRSNDLLSRFLCMRDCILPIYCSRAFSLNSLRNHVIKRQIFLCRVQDKSIISLRMKGNTKRKQ
jgi:hypothetical protein